VKLYITLKPRKKFLQLGSAAAIPGEKPAIPGMNWGNLLGAQGLSSNHVELGFCNPPKEAAFFW